MPQAKRRKITNPLGLAVLALLRERPMHPYQMAATLRERAKEQSIKLNYGSLYSVIAALKRAGLVRARETGRAGARPERTIYELTAPGAAELRDWMRTLLRLPVKEYPQFEAALSLMPVLPPDEVAALLEERLGRLETEMAELRATLARCTTQGLERLFVIEAEYELAMREAERAWVGELVHLMRTSPDFTRTWRAFHVRSGRSRPRATTESRSGVRRQK
jgi:DNA-binding PadR family transcriptional regulator